MTVTERVESSLDSDADYLEAIQSARSASATTRAADRAAGRAGWRRERLVYRWAAAIGDLGIVTAFTLLLMREHEWRLGAGVPLVVGLVFVFVVGVNHGYDSRRAVAGLHEFRAIGAGLLALAFAVLMVDFVGLVELRVAPSLLCFGVTAVSVTLVRLAERSVARAARNHGYLRRRTVVIGPEKQLAPVLQDLRDGARHGFEIVGVCLPAGEARTVQSVDKLPVWGSVSDAAVLVASNRVDAVVVSSAAMDVDELRRFRWAIEHLETEVLIAPNLNEVLSGRVELRAVSTLPLLTVTSGPTRAQRAIKDVMDRVLAVMLLVIFAPVIGGAALLVRTTSPGKAIFRQVRIGVDGRPFTMLKLRSMVVDAEARRSDLESDGSKGAGAQFKLVADPRVTPVGRVMRRFSIDELPQLWNVFRGDMSLVGPRPPLPSEVATYDAMAVHRLHVKPGVTGLWQVSGRSDLSWEESVRLDLRYVDNFSLLRDVQILWRTFRAVFGAHGAY